ncbi:hypothetical protein FRB93_005001 [Tulasnella sp. JGI-2019a]|nr:hypothetical protein FRB93_005001 [Tulasnella sp. JGI-2019a]
MESDRRSTNGGDPSISSFSDDTNFTTWDDMVYAQSAMYKDSVRNNVVLRSQVEKMRDELEVWKMGFNTKAREKEELEAKVARLETEIQTMAAQQVSVKEKEVLETKVARMERSLTAIHEENPLVVCVVDGDGAVFSEMYLTRGREGGRDAAAAFNTAIKSHLDIHNDGVNNVMGSQSVSDSDEFNTSSRRIVSPQILCTIYFNRGGLCPTLLKNGVCTAQDFHDFCIGFNQALPLFTLIDVGDGKEAADTKVRKSLELFARLPQTRKVFFAGAHDNGYMPTLMSLRTEGHLRKLVLMKGYSTVAYEFEMFLQETAVDVMDLPDLFLKQKLVSAGHPRLQRQPLSFPGVSHQFGSSPSPVDASGGRLPAEGLTSPKTWSSNVQSAQAGLKQPQSLSFPGHKFDPKKVCSRLHLGCVFTNFGTIQISPLHDKPLLLVLPSILTVPSAGLTIPPANIPILTSCIRRKLKNSGLLSRSRHVQSFVSTTTVIRDPTTVTTRIIAQPAQNVLS